MWILTVLHAQDIEDDRFQVDARRGGGAVREEEGRKRRGEGGV
jgi:hypothetical protein